MMSGNDIRDIMQLGAPPTAVKRSKHTEKEKKPDGISRELFSLIGGAPPLALTKPAYKAKPNLKKKVTSWAWRPFINPAREDRLILHHWVKVSDEEEEYHFAKFNKVIDVIEYTDEEYSKYLHSSDWSREETDYLFDMGREYDLRFIAMADRYEYPGRTRTIEDLKERYYDINRRLLKARSPSAGEISAERQTLINQFQFDKAREIERKKNLNLLFKRTPEQIEEEEALFIEAKRIQENEKKLAKERDSLLRFLQLQDGGGPHGLNRIMIPGLGIGSGASTPTGSGPPTPFGASLSDKKKKKNRSEPSTPTTDSAIIAIASDKKQRRMSNASVSSNATVSDVGKNELVSPLDSLVEKRDKLVPGVFVRSQKIAPPKANMIQKVTKTMDELGIGLRPIMPTAAVCAKFEQLQNSIVTLHEVKKMAEKLEHDLKVRKLQKQKEGSAGVESLEGSQKKRAISTNAARDAKRPRK